MDKQISTMPKPRKLRGWATYEGDEFTFKPTEEGQPSQLNVRTTKGGKLFTTTSTEKPKQVAHLSCPLDTPDPWAEYTSQLLKLGIKPQREQELTEKQRIVCESNVQVFLDAKANALTYQASIDLTKTLNWQSEVMRQLQVIMRTLPMQEKLKKLITKLQKGGKK
ncbi:MAG: hypothetical protein IJ762_08105 [Bacteroidaceae bacterium]|nr:hypothetical protein [Bacteroidaceae bacterium]